jgi:hypothetical protein
MTATLSVRVQTGAPTGSESNAQTGIDFESADNNLNTLANRQANPITIGAVDAYSFEKWCKLKCDVAPANFCSNFKYWSAQGGVGGAGTGLTIMGEGVIAIASYASPVSTGRGTAIQLPTTQGAASAWDNTTSLSSIGNVTKYLVLQLRVNSTATQGNMAQATIR